MLKDLNYFPLDVESNIYGMTKLEFDDKTTKVLVATLDCRVYCISYKGFKPQTREVEFTYIPNGARIISIGALKQGHNNFAIGITHSLSPTISKSTPSREIAGDIYNSRQTTYYFNIYASESVLPSFDLDHVAQGCQTIRLRYVPYQLYCSELLSYDQPGNHKTINRKPFWLLTGGDSFIHAYSEDRPYQSFNEISITDFFPELCSKQPSIAIWIDVANIVDCKDGSGDIIVERATALGLEDGTVKLFQSILDTQTNTFKLVRTSSFDSYTTIIPCVRLFKIDSTNNESPFRRLAKNIICDNEPNHDDLDRLNLLVVSSTNPCLVFNDVLHKGLDDPYKLPESQRVDCVTTAAVADINVDGCNELLIATHGKELMTYAYNYSSSLYELNDINKLNYPIFAITALDLSGDGLKDLVVLLAKGILIMQSSVKDVLNICEKRVRALLSAIK